MEKSYLLKWAPLALLLPCFSSCNEKLEIIAENSTDVIKREAMKAALKEYTQNFVKIFGEMDPNHDWGMNMPGIQSDLTRATVDNRNEWVNRYHLEVPGWPDIYEKTDGTTGNNGYHYLNSAGVDATYSGSTDGVANAPATGCHPAGDVTDEEIQYVSWWFRTHQNPEGIRLHWTDFYVQGISADNDRVMDGVNAGNKIDVLERYEKTDGVFSEKNSDQLVTYTIDYFSAQYLERDEWGNEWDHIKNYNRQNSNILSGEHNLYVGTDSVPSSIWSLDANFKNQLTSVISNRLINFYQSSGTENFEAHYSQNNADLDWNYPCNMATGKMLETGGNSSWVLVHLPFVGPSGRIYDNYYLAFDYQCYKEEETDGEGNVTKFTYHAADGYYSNWIFKLSPALPHTHNETYTGLSRRIMCEDLGNTFDFDFNDVVFDATYNITQEEYNGYLNGTKTDSPIDVTITLQAAGGTLPIYVGLTNVNETFEAHHLLGNHPHSQPVNVDAPGGAMSSVAIYHYKLDFPQGLSTVDQRQQALNLNNIPILVVSNDNKGTYLTGSDVYWGNEYPNPHYTPSNTGNRPAPRAFGVPLNVCWMKECKFIETSYVQFPLWVHDQVTYGDNADAPWYMEPNVKNTNNIYTYKSWTKPAENSPAATITDYSSQYGPKLPIITSNVLGADYYLIAFDEFKQQPGQYCITAVCVSANKPGLQEVQEPKLARARWNNGGWEEDSDSQNLISGTVTRSSDYETTGIYTVQFSVDVNSANFDDYTHFVIKYMYDKTNDKVGDLHVIRTGDSAAHGPAAYELDDSYGEDAEEEVCSPNEYWNRLLIPISKFSNTSNGRYRISIAANTQNEASQFSTSNYQVKMTKKDTDTEQAVDVESCSSQVLSGATNDNIVLIQFDVQFPLSNEGNCGFVEITNIFSGLNPTPSYRAAIKDVKIKDITPEPSPARIR